MSALLWKFNQVTLSGLQRPRLDDISMQIGRGVTAIVGYSGAGKTSLLNLLVRFEMPTEGRIITSLPASQRRLPLFWVPQNDGLWPHLRAGAHLQVVMSAGNNVQTRAVELLDRFDLADKIDVRPQRMSQGERARLAVARALASRAAVLVMDEPLVHVDPARIANYWQIIRDHCRDTQTSLVLATHSSETVLSEAEHAVCLKQGRVMFSGRVDDLYFRPATPELAEFLGAVNWFSADEASRWLDNPEDDRRCYRPEQISVTRADESRLVVQSSRFAGSIAEVELLDEETESQRRFYHRPAADRLGPGDRVLLRACLTLLLLCLLLVGCNRDEPILKVREINYWSMPPDGPRIPAPRSLTIGQAGEVLCLDNAGRVLVFDETGDLQRQWKMPEVSAGNPEGLCVFEDGRIVVADTHYHRLVFFDQQGKLLSTMGSQGQQPGEFIYPVAIVQDPSENFFVCEYGGDHRVQKFTLQGKFVLQFGGFGTGPGEFQRPSGIIWHAGRVFVVDAFNNRIQVFSDTGEFVEILGASAGPVALHYPYDIAKSAAGEFFVIEYGAGRVTKLDHTGKLLGRFGKSGHGEGEFQTPWGLAIDSQQRLRIADTANRRIVELKL